MIHAVANRSEIRHYLERSMPGYAALFPNDDVWTRPVAMAIARHALVFFAIAGFSTVPSGWSA
ncbi:MAG: hypothetical protein HUU20_00675 [Pirellulales bacterium]|nr:hypothetical protein [Pirellulales bacterium]